VQRGAPQSEETIGKEPKEKAQGEPWASLFLQM